MLHALPGVAAASPASVGVLLDWPAAGADSAPVSPTSRAKTPHSRAAPRPTRDGEPAPFKPGGLAPNRPRVPAPPPAPSLACSFTWVPPFLGAWVKQLPGVCAAPLHPSWCNGHIGQEPITVGHRNGSPTEGQSQQAGGPGRGRPDGRDPWLGRVAAGDRAERFRTPFPITCASIS